VANVHVLSFHGEIDISRKRWLEKELGQIERFGPNAVTILDLTNVRYLDTTFLNALIRIAAHVSKQQQQSSVCVVAPHGRLSSRLFEVADLDSRFRMFDDVSSARRYASAP